MIRLCAFSDEAAESLNGQIHALIRNEITYTELRSVDGKNVRDFTAEEAKSVYKELIKNNIQVWAIGSPIGKIPISVPLETCLNEVRHVCQIANELRTDKVRIFSFYEAYEQREKVLEYLNHMVEAAQKYGVKLYHENEKNIYGDTAERVLDIMQNVPQLRYVYDPANFIQVGENAKKTISLLSDKCDYFHMKDIIASTGELVPVGYGDGEIAQLIAKINRDTVFTVEPHLKVFAGYDAIDSEKLKGKFVYQDNRCAFDAAVKAVKDLLGYKS